MAIGRLAGAVYARRAGPNNAVLRLAGTSAKHMIDKVTSNTATVFEVQRTQLESTGTAAAGLGARSSWYCENASGNAAELSRIDHVLVTATDGAEDAKIDFYVNTAGTVTKVFSLGTTGPTFTVSTTMDFSGGATNFSIKDNSATALTIKQGSNTYFKIDTTDNTEVVTVGNSLSTVNFVIVDNTAAAFTIKESTNSYLTCVSTNGSESVAIGQRLTTTDGVASGTARVVGGLAARSVAASTAITNTTTETAFDTGSYTIPADTLKAGSQIRVKWQGIATTTANTDTLQIKVYIGSTAIATGTATDVANSNIFDGEAWLSVRTAGASGTFVGNSNHTKVPAASLTASRVSEIIASTTINTTTTQAITVKATWGTADTNDSVRLDMFAVWID